jgi:hypothetical protein
LFFVIRTPISPPHPRQAHGTSPLHAATHWGDVEVVRSLLARGADVDAVDEQGQTPLHVALHHEEVAGELLARGAALHIVRVRTHSHSLTLPHTPSHSLTLPHHDGTCSCKGVDCVPLSCSVSIFFTLLGCRFRSVTGGAELLSS